MVYKVGDRPYGTIGQAPADLKSTHGDASSSVRWRKRAKRKVPGRHGSA